MMSAPVTPSGDGVNLPTLFQRVEYLQGSGSAYINTGYYPNTDTEIYLRGGWVSNSIDNPLFAVDAGVYVRTAFTCATTTNNRVVLVIQDFANTKYLYSVGSVVDIYLNKNEYSFDGVSTPTGKSISFTSQFPLHLLGWDRSGNNILCGTGRICKCQISESGVLIHDLYPCYRKSDNKPGMFDLVTRQFFTNAATSGNDFTVGPDIPSTSPYVIFVDPAVEAICVANWSQDGLGVTMQELQGVTNIGTLFRYTTAKSFDEFKFFTGVTTIPTLAFANTTALVSIELPNTVVELGAQSFNLAQAIKSIVIPSSVTTIRQYVFINNNALDTAVVLPTTPPTNDGGNFSNPSKVYVPYSADHSILAAYQSANNWSAIASKLYELNPDGTIPTT